MSTCNPCLRVKNISKCTEAIQIGEVSDPYLGYTIYFKNTATGKIVFFTGELSGGVVLTVHPVYGFLFSEGQDYEVWVTVAGTGIEDMIEFHVEGVGPYEDDPTCILVSFVRVYDTNEGHNINFESQIFSV